MPSLFNKWRGRLAAEAVANIGSCVAISAPLEIQAGVVEEGKLPTFSIQGYTGASMKLAGWRYPMIIELAGLRVASEMIPALRNHDDDRVVGHTTAYRKDDSGLHFEGVVSGVGADALEVVKAAHNGFGWKASIGAVPLPGSVEHLPAGRKATVNGREIEGPHSIVRAAMVNEISFVPRGADGSTSAVIAAQYQGECAMFEEWIQAKGFDLATLTAAQKNTLQAAYDAEQTAGDGSIKAAATASDIQAMVSTAVKEATTLAVAETTKQIKAEQQRSLAISRLCGGYPDIAAKAAAENWSLDKVELEIERASRPRPIFASGGGAPDSGLVIEAAICVNAGMDEEVLRKNFDEPTINAAVAGRLRGFGLHALMYEVIRAAGRSVAPGIVGNELIRAAFEADQQIRASGVSNYSLSGTVSNVANKFIVAGFNSVEQTWRSIAKIGSVKDFKATSGYRLTGDFTYEEIGKSGELKHAEMGETTYSNQAKTYGKIFGIGRSTLINDDLNVIEETARMRIGRGAGLKINSVFWTDFMNNGSFFTAGRNNYFEGAATNLQISSLTTAETLFLNQTDENGDPVNLEPKILLVPNALNVLASQLTRDLEVRDTTASTKYTTGNPHAGKFRVERSSYLGNAAISGNSVTAWYLLCDPQETGVGVVELVFLNGKQEPTVESTTLDFDQLGMQMRGYHDFGSAKQEYRCGVKSKGAA